MKTILRYDFVGFKDSMFCEILLLRYHYILLSMLLKLHDKCVFKKLSVHVQDDLLCKS